MTRARWEAADIGDQTGRHFVVTGGNSGLGAATATALAAAGARVTLACRNQTTARAVADRIGAAAAVAPLDLADLASVRAFADTVDAVDVLINNAGVMAVPYRRTVDGFELQMGTNHLGHFALTGLLLPKIGDRVVTVSSMMQYGSRLQFFDDLNWERRRYNRWVAYGDSKLADLMFGLELADRLHRAGSSTIAAVAHPGYADTGLLGGSGAAFDAVAGLGSRLRLGQTPERGALPTLYAATAPDVVGGGYYGPDRFAGLRGHPAPARPRRAARDRELRGRLWRESERLTGVVFGV